MLAYELFYNNKDRDVRNTKNQYPIKKIFYKDGKIIIDEKGLEEYGSETTKSTRELQDWLQMPLNTTNSEKYNLPDFRTGSAAANPYVEIYGTVKTNKSSETKLEITIGKKEKSSYVSYVSDLSTGKDEREIDGKPTLRIDKKNYFINSKTLFSEYVSSGIIDEQGVLNMQAYDSIVEEFLKFAKKQSHNITKPGTTRFRIYVLPDDSVIEFKKTDGGEEDPKQGVFTDYLGFSACRYASTPTKTAKFLSFDDKAFTINCTKKEEFYKNLGIGDKSLDKIFIDPSQTFTIGGLGWTFADISNIDHRFEETKKGILTQLYENYMHLTRNEDAGTAARAQLKVICIRSNQAKQEVLIDENLTMGTMKKMFLGMEDIPPLCFEVLIDNSGRNTIWNTYLYAVKNFLMNNRIPKDYLLSFFNKSIRRDIHGWLKLPNDTDQKEFFKKSNYCMQHLSNRNGDTYSYMDKNEEFAERVGQIVKVYMDFKQNNKEIDNSLSDIMTYSKYDRERLRFIVARIGKGVQLSKISDEQKNATTEKIRRIQPDEEIADDVASKDYSYFFFKGYYSNTKVPA